MVPPQLQEVFPVLRTIVAVIYPASVWKVICLPGLDETFAHFRLIT